MELVDCSGRETHQETPNKISRRGLIGGAVTALFLLKTSALTGVRLLAGQTPLRTAPACPSTPLKLACATAFLATGNTVQLGNALEHGEFLDRDEMFLSIVSKREHWVPGTGAYEWMSRFTPAKGEDALETWKIGFSLVPTSLVSHSRNGYRFAVYNEQWVMVTDENAIGYRAPRQAVIPDLSKLVRAADFPGAVAAND